MHALEKLHSLWRVFGFPNVRRSHKEVQCVTTQMFTKIFLASETLSPIFEIPVGQVSLVLKKNIITPTQPT